MNDLKQQVALTALNKMMSQGHFSICTIDSIAKLLDITPNAEAYALLRPLHCIDYAAMPRELYARLPGIIEAALSGPEIFQFQLALKVPEHTIALIETRPKTKLLARIFNHG